MDCCRFVDYSERTDCLIELYNFDCVTHDNIRDAKSVVPSDNFLHVEVGDRIVSYIIDNRIEGIQAALTIWHNKSVACLDKGEGLIWGEWLKDEKLVLTYEFAEVKDACGMIRVARIAYNIHGLRGNCESGRFYTLFCGGDLLNYHEKRGGAPWNVQNARRRSG